MDGAELFAGWGGVIRVVVIAALAYGALVLLLRISGKRTLSKMNAFDLIVTVALGSTLATVVLSKDIALAEGIAAFAALIGLQFAITWLSVRSPAVAHAVKAEPALLFYRSRFLPDQLRRARVVEDEVRAAVRAQGIAALDGIEAVVLETDGSFSVVQRADGAATSLGDLEPDGRGGGDSYDARRAAPR